MSTTAYRLSRTISSGSSAGSFFFGILAALLGISGLFTATILLWPCALLAAIAAILIEPKAQSITYCEACGNDVAPTSRHCPHCHTDLIAAPQPRRRLSPILLGTLIFTGLIALFYLWLYLR